MDILNLSELASLVVLSAATPEWVKSLALDVRDDEVAAVRDLGLPCRGVALLVPFGRERGDHKENIL